MWGEGDKKSEVRQTRRRQKSFKTTYKSICFKNILDFEKSVVFCHLSKGDIGSLKRKNKQTLISYLFGSTVFADFYLFKLYLLFIFILHQVGYAVSPSFWFVLLINVRLLDSQHLLILSFVYLNFVIYYFVLGISWCTFIRFVNKSYMFYVVFCCCLNWIQAIDTELLLI